ncbi:MAG: pentapeptide repeat-containing protein [Cyanobacteria bacterium J06554_11]
MDFASGLSIEKPVSAWNSDLKVDFKDAFKALTKAGIDGFVQNWVGVFKDLIDAANAVGAKSERPEQLAWTLIYASMVRAIKGLVEQNQDFIKSVPSNAPEIVERLDFSFENRKLAITERFFEHPEQLSLIAWMQPTLTGWFEEMGVSADKAIALSNQLPTSFVFELEKEWRRHPELYSRITSVVKTPFTEADERAMGWQLYKTWLQQQIEKPMMTEAFGLDRVYVPLRAYIRCKQQANPTEAEATLSAHRDDGGKYERVVVDLETSLKAWLKVAERNDAIRVISGGPGSGKSSFAKIFAAHHAKQSDFPVLFVPLHLFDLKGDFTKAFEEFIRYEEYITDNPLDPDNDGLRLLIIFDGLDELAMQGKLSKETAKEFVREVQAKVGQFNRRKARLQVIFTGRELAVQEAFRNISQILHVLPYFVPEDKREKADGEPYVDEQGLLVSDQRDAWWQKYGIATQRSYTAMPTDLNIKSLLDITGQPLLNYLLALTYVQGTLALSAATNLNTIYADLLRGVYERRYEDERNPNERRHAAIGDMSQENFIRILEEIALATWHGNGRTTTVKEIEMHCERSGLIRLLKVFEREAEAGVTRLLTAFYFRQSGEHSSERTFEFTHKSFGEYLTVRRIVRTMARIQKQLERRQEDMEEGWDERDALKYWAEVCGPTQMDAYLLRFLEAEVALKESEQVKKWQETLSHLIGVMLCQGMPMEKIEPPLKYVDANRWAINAEEALLAALSACAQVTRTLSKVDWPTPAPFGSWLHRLKSQSVDDEMAVAPLSLGYLDLSKTDLRVQNLSGARLRGSNLDNAILSGARLRGAHLSRASLRRALLSGAQLNAANLRGANLRGARLSRANLTNARLDGANLRGANLSGANLRGARLSGANLTEARLDGANLTNAHLDGANLNGVHFGRPSFVRGLHHGENLEEANLRNVIWDEKTDWRNVRGLDRVRNIPIKLREHLSNLP